MWKEILTNYFVPTVVTLISGLFAWLGTKVKALIETRIKNEEIKEIVENVVMYTEQKAKNLTSNEKFSVALSKASEWLHERNIKVSDTELEILIEAAVNNFYGKEVK